jgi:hypothetical protein
VSAKDQLVEHWLEAVQDLGDEFPPLDVSFMNFLPSRIGREKNPKRRVEKEELPEKEIFTVHKRDPNDLAVKRPHKRLLSEPFVSNASQKIENVQSKADKTTASKMEKKEKEKIAKADEDLEEILKEKEAAFKQMEFNEENTMVCDFQLLPEYRGSCVAGRGFPLNEKDRAELQRQVCDLVAKGFVEPVPGDQQPQAVSPAFLVAKPDGSKRLVVDYSKLNRLVAPCALPLPLMDPILDNLSACRFKTKMDLQAGFWQVRLSDSAKSLTAFILPDQTVFRFKVLPMGLSVSPGVFQSFTSRHVRNFKQDPVVQHLFSSGSVVEVMVDDFVLGSPSRAEHLQLLRLWLTYAVDNWLYFKRAKCVFMQPSLEVLGRWVGFRQWGPLPNKLEKIIVKKPTCVAELRSL